MSRGSGFALCLPHLGFRMRDSVRRPERPTLRRQCRSAMIDLQDVCCWSLKTSVAGTMPKVSNELGSEAKRDAQAALERTGDYKHRYCQCEVTFAPRRDIHPSGEGLITLQSGLTFVHWHLRQHREGRDKRAVGAQRPNGGLNSKTAGGNTTETAWR